MSGDIPLTIECTYTCSVCGLLKVPVQVPARGEEGVVEWTRNVLTPALVADHKRRSSLCRAAEFAEVMIPLTGADKIGGAAKQ